MKRFVYLLLLIGLAGGGYYGYRYYEKSKAPAPVAAAPQARGGVPVEVAKIERGTVNEEVEALGTLAADESVVIAPEIAGRVIALGFKEGERVEKGQVLVKLDTAILDAELKQQQPGDHDGTRRFVAGRVSRASRSPGTRPWTRPRRRPRRALWRR